MVRTRHTVSPLRYGIKFLKKYRARLAFAIFWSTLFVIIPMQVPVITGTLVDGLDINTGGNDTPILFYGVIEVGNTPYSVLLFTFSSLLFVAITYGFAAYLSISSSSTISRNFAFELQKELVRKLEFLSLDIHAKYGSGDLLNRAIIDTNNVRPFIEATIIKTISNIVRISYPLIMLFMIDSFLALIATFILPIQFLIIRHLQSKIGLASTQLRKDKARLTMLQKENLDAVETIQTSNAETYSIQKISNQIEKVEESQVTIQKYYGKMMGFAWGLTTLGLALSWSFGGLKVLSGEITLGQLIIFTGFVVFAYIPVRKLTQTVKEHHRGLVAMKHIQEILETSSSIEESENPKDLNIVQGNILIRNAVFSFKLHNKNRTVLRNVNISIKPKSLTAIVGRSGSGKSFILKLITRLYDPTEGQVLIDGQDIKRVSIQSLRSQIAVVPQVPVLFTGTVKENILLANPNATDIEVEQACLNADALRFIKKLKKGLDTVIGQRGVILSGGEAQRIAIARALLKRAKILLLDEPSSAIDPESTTSIMNTLYNLKKDMTIVLVGHNREATMKADNLITIDNGRVVEVVEDGIMKRIQLESGSCIVYSQDTLNYVYIANNDNENKISLVDRNSKSPVAKINPIEERQASDLLEWKMIGRSAKQRRMNVVLIGNKTNPQLKIFILAGQHGDEKYGRMATERLIEYLLKTKLSDFPNMCIAVMPDANPDGARKNGRRTVTGTDMNRDHVRLNSQETRAIHSFLKSWKPNLIIDVHNYPPIRRYLKERNYAFCHDVLVDAPSNLSVYKRLEPDKFKTLLNEMQLDLNRYNHTCDRYVLINPEGRVRHSTHDITDARNFLSLRYNTLTLLLEAKEPLLEDGKNGIESTILSQYLALLSLIKWASKNLVYLLENSHGSQYKKGDKIVISCKYIAADHPFKMNFKNLLTKKIEEVALPNYESAIKATRHIVLPLAYAIPKEQTRILELLQRHGFIAERVNDSRLRVVEAYSIRTLKPLNRETESVSDTRLTVSQKKQTLTNYVVFPINQVGGHTLALLLEPKSEYGFIKYNHPNLNLTWQTDYPILRVMELETGYE
jgi:ABC-type multidrug transport system fused ATPase/permease subunit